MSNPTLAVPPTVQDSLELDQIRHDPLSFLERSRQRYGDVFQYQVDQWKGVVVNVPDAIRMVLHSGHDLFSKMGTPDLMMLKPMLGEGLMTSEGENWLFQRRMAQPAFMREAIATFTPHIVDATQQMLARWATAAGPIQLEDEMSRFTLQIVARCLFGFNISDESTAFGEAVHTMNQFMAHYDPQDTTGLQRFQQALLTLHMIVEQIIQQQRSKPASDNLLGRMIVESQARGQPLSNQQLRDQIFTFLMAGHETTAKSLTWTIYLLGQNPQAKAQLKAEAADVLQGRKPTYADVDSLSYTWMVLQESMRLYPPVWLMSRIAQKDVELAGYHIEAGRLVIISPYLMHRHPGYWDEPLNFDPTRFAPQRSAQITPYTYFPFSSGSRICIGKPFATLETILVLASIAQHHDLQLLAGHLVEPEALVTLRPKYGMPMNVSYTHDRRTLSVE